MNTILLLAFIVGSPIGTPGIILTPETYFDRRSREATKEAAGWPLVRDAFGLEATDLPVEGVVLSCVENV